MCSWGWPWTCHVVQAGLDLFQAPKYWDYRIEATALDWRSSGVFAVVRAADPVSRVYSTAEPYSQVLLPFVFFFFHENKVWLNFSVWLSAHLQPRQVWHLSPSCLSLPSSWDDRHMSPGLPDCVFLNSLPFLLSSCRVWLQLVLRLRLLTKVCLRRVSMHSPCPDWDFVNLTLTGVILEKKSQLGSSLTRLAYGKAHGGI